jgi:hypothetical protein
MLQDRLYDQILLLYDILKEDSGPKEQSDFEPARELVRQELIE